MNEVKLNSIRLHHKIMVSMLSILIFFLMGCSTKYYRYFFHKEALFTVLVPDKEIPSYEKYTVCQGPAVLYLKSDTLSCIVRCYDSNNDGEMLSLVNLGIDVFEYSLFVILKDENGRPYYLIKKHPHVVIIDTDFDGIGDDIYIFKFIASEAIPIYEKIDIKAKNLIMAKYSSSKFRLSDFKPYLSIVRE